MINKETYLKNPCGELSIPFWKAKQIQIPKDMKILHHRDFDKTKYKRFTDEPYFRMSHDLKGLSMPQLPNGYVLCDASMNDFANHINQCYDGTSISETDLQNYTDRPVYNYSLWIAVKDNTNNNIIATGIAELDYECNEGILEWIQVSKNYRGIGLGSYIVNELLWRMKDIAEFATVSGKCNNPTNPEGLYRKCGFVGNNIWHILKKKHS